MARVLVIGGGGFYGSKVVEQLRRDHEVVIGSRRAGQPGQVAIDLNRPETFAALREFELLVNCSDSVQAVPDAAILATLEHGGTWFEMGADVTSTERLLAMKLPSECRGTALIGVGVFPGISTALARAVVEQQDQRSSVELGIRISPLSGAGFANCVLMAESLFVPAFWHRDGARVEAKTAVGPSVAMPYLTNGELRSAPSSAAALPDSGLVHASCGVSTSVVRFSIKPNWLRFNFALLAWLMRWFRFARRPLSWSLAWQLYLLRGLLLRKVESRVEMVAIADRGLASERGCALSFADGQTATALGVAATVHAWTSDANHPTGLFGVTQVIGLDALLAGLAHLGHPPELRWITGSAG